MLNVRYETTYICIAHSTDSHSSVIFPYSYIVWFGWLYIVQKLETIAHVLL